MRHGLGPTLALMLPAFLLGIFLAYGRGGEDFTAEREAFEARIQALADSLDDVEGARLALEALYAGMVRRAREATERAEAARDSVGMWRDRWASMPRPAPFDTAAWMAAIPGLMAAADSSQAVCDRAVQSCHEALAAERDRAEVADSLRAALARGLELQTTRGDLFEDQWRETQDRLERAIRWRTPRDILMAVLGGGTMAVACYASR